MKLLFALLFTTIVIWAQSDCGNCYLVGGGCGPSDTVDCAPGCQICIYYFDCDYHNCAFSTGPYCSCNNFGRLQLDNKSRVQTARNNVKIHHTPITFWRELRNPLIVEKSTPVPVVIPSSRWWWIKKVKV